MWGANQMTKFIVKRKFLSIFSLSVFNESKKQLFHIKDQWYRRKREYKIHDEFGHVQTRIVKKIGKKHIINKVYMDEQTIATITMNKGYSSKEFVIEPQELVAKPGGSKLTFIVTRDGESFGTIHTKLFRLSNTYTIEIATFSEVFMLIMITLTLFIDEREPSFFSIFKNLNWFIP